MVLQRPDNDLDAERCSQITAIDPVGSSEPGIRRVTFQSDPGDSGSPVYVKLANGKIKKRGLLIASNEGTGLSDFVTLARVEKQLGVKLFTG